MAETQPQDERFGQLQKDYENELQASAGLFSAKGFGRSTENLKAGEAIGQSYKDRVATLNSIIALEAVIKSGQGSEGLFKQLESLYNQFAQQGQASAGRMSKLIQAGNEFTAQAKNKIQGTPVRRGIKVSSKTYGLKGVSSMQPQSQTKEKRIFAPVKSLSSVISPSKMFSKNLTPKRKMFHF